MKARFIVLGLLMMAAVSAAIVHVWPQLPEVVAVHWNWRGEADGFGPRAVLWLLGPGLMAVITLLALVLPSLSPRDHGVFAARLMVCSGLLGLVLLAAGVPGWLLLVPAIAWAPVAVLYSLLQYKRLDVQ